MDACSVFRRDITRDQNCSFVFHAQKHKCDLWGQLRWGVTSQMLSGWCPRTAASCLFERQHLPVPWQILPPIWDTACQPRRPSWTGCWPVFCLTKFNSSMMLNQHTLFWRWSFTSKLQYNILWSSHLLKKMTHIEKKALEPINIIFSRSDTTR